MGVKALFLILAAAPSWGAVLPVPFEAARAPLAVFSAGPAGLSAQLSAVSAPSLPSSPVPALAPALQPPVAAPLPADAPGIGRIAVVGDAGTADGHQRKIADAMAAERARAPYAAVLVLGDNVYQNGEPEKFDAAIRDPYSALFDGGARFFPVMGNHDVRTGGGEQQRAYWGAPRWYKKTIGDAEVFALDTTVLLPRHQKAAYDADLSEAERLGREQLAWLDAELARSTAKHVVVYGHHPLYVSTHDPVKVEESARLRALLEPILLKHGVKLYLAGHKHHYERSRPVGGVTHVISGAGGQLAKEPLIYHSGVAEKVIKRRHFLVLEATEEGLHIRALDKDGAVLDEFVIRR
jgi:acid phosphatase